ncbi:MAG: hypothetical protein ACP5NX_02005 [Candidatus Bilamarchaeaceae archaeon]
MATPFHAVREAPKPAVPPKKPCDACPFRNQPNLTENLAGKPKELPVQSMALMERREKTPCW